MCEYCHCYGNNHDPMCPNYVEPKGVLHLTCAVCDCLFWGKFYDRVINKHNKKPPDGGNQSGG